MPKFFRDGLAVLALGALLVVGAAPAGARTNKRFVAESKECKGNDAKAAVIACTRLLSHRNQPPLSRAGYYFQRGDAYRRMSEYDSAITDFDEAIRLNPTFAIAYHNRGFAYNEKGEYDQAIRDFDEAIRLKLKNATAYHNRGFAYSKKGDYERAIRDFDEAIRINPRYAVAYHSRGAAHNRKHDYDRAIRDLDEAIRLNPKQADAYNDRGFAYSGKSDYERAIRDFGEAIRINPKYAVAYHNRGAAYNRKRDYDRAIHDLDEAIRLYPKYAMAYSTRGTAHILKKEYDLALADANEIIRIDPKAWSGYHLRALSHFWSSEFELAKRDFDEAIRLAPNNPTMIVSRGATYKELKQYDRALADINEAIRISDGKFARHYFHRGDTYFRIGDRERALADLYRVFELNPSERDIRDAKATLAKLDAAKTDAKPALAVAPTALGTRVALVIGNSDYRFANKLNNPKNDATDLSALLRKLGFDVVEGLDLDKHGMEAKIRAFGNNLDSADLALFFYAGHGIAVAGKNYLVPIDAKLKRAGDLSLDTVEVGDVLAQMEARRRVNLVFLDACRDNPLARSFASRLGTRSATVGRGLAAIQSGIGTMIAYATQPENVALDGHGRNSPFTTALLKHLDTPGADIGMIMRQVRTDVIAATHEQQVPWDHSSLTGEVVLAR